MPSRELSRGGRTALLVASLVASLLLPLVYAQEVSTKAVAEPQLMDSLSLQERYPAGSIQSNDQAVEALRQVHVARSKIQTEFAEDERICHREFFANVCLSEAKERRRRASARVRNIELEANQYKRQLRVMERDKVLAEKRAADEADEATTEVAAKDSAPQSPTSTEVKSDTKSATRKAVVSRRVIQHQAKLNNLQATELAEEEKRAQNVAAYEKKVRDAEARQRYIAEKKKKEQKD